MEFDRERDRLLATVGDEASARQRVVEFTEAVRRTGQQGRVWIDRGGDAGGGPVWRIYLRLST